MYFFPVVSRQSIWQTVSYSMYEEIIEMWINFAHLYLRNRWSKINNLIATGSIYIYSKYEAIRTLLLEYVAVLNTVWYQTS